MDKVIEEQRKRNYGIDLLRVVAMFFVVVLHCFGHGGVLNSAVPNSVQYKTSWIVEIAAYCAVDIFAMISGYVMFSNNKKKMDISKYLSLWLQVVFYGIVITAIFNIFIPEKISKDTYLMHLLPVTNNLWWYFTAYTGLYIFIPIINSFVRENSEATCKKVFIVLILLYSIYNIIPNVFILNGGYSVIWLIILYILGAIIKKCNIGRNLKWYHKIIMIFAMIFCTYLYKMYGYEFQLFNINITKGLLVSYTSPTVLIIAIMYLLLFSKFKFNKVFEKIITFGASSSFAIYIINEQKFIRENIMVNKFTELATGSTKVLLLKVIAFSIIFVLAAILVDKIRIGLFKLLRIDKICKKIVGLIDNGFDKVVNTNQKRNKSNR